MFLNCSRLCSVLTWWLGGVGTKLRPRPRTFFSDLDRLWFDRLLMSLFWKDSLRAEMFSFIIWRLSFFMVGNIDSIVGGV